MNHKLRVLGFLLLFALPLLAREKSDVLVMRNGDHLTCAIKSLEADTLSISLDYAAGTISINWGKVDHIESNQLFLVKTQDGLAWQNISYHEQVLTAGNQQVTSALILGKNKSLPLRQN